MVIAQASRLMIIIYDHMFIEQATEF